MPKSWYMIYTRQNSEKRICALLKRKKIENFCPLNRTQFNRFGKSKFLSVPLFSFYVFARLEKDDFRILDSLKSILTVVYWKDKPAVIEDEEIDTIKEFVDLHLDIQLEKLKIGFSNSTITNGLTYTVNKKSVSVQTRFIRVQLPSIGFIMTAETGRKNIFAKDLFLMPIPTLSPDPDKKNLKIPVTDRYTMSKRQ